MQPPEREQPGTEPRLKGQGGHEEVSASPDKGRGIPWHLWPLWAGAAGAAGLLALLILLVPDIRAWFAVHVGYPVAATVLGRDFLLVDGVRVEAAPDVGVTAAFALMVVFFLLALRAWLINQGETSWTRRIRLDTPFMLALVPYLALAPLLTTLAALQLFRVPWAFFAVAPLVVLLVVACIVVSLFFAVWIEAGQRERGPRRFLLSVLLFLLVGLFWIVALGGTTAPLRWWIAVPAVALVVIVQYSVTLGNRIHSHRRALFSLGWFHLAFFTGFLVLWFIEGPWPVQDWSIHGQNAVRGLVVQPDGPLLFALLLGGPVLIAVAVYTIGAFLNRYTDWAAVWVDGLSLLVLFALVLESWSVTMMAVDPYGALAQSLGAPGPVSAWATGLLGGWGYFWGSLIVAIALVWSLSLPLRMRTGTGMEARTIVLGIVAGAFLIRGLRYTLQVAVGA